MNLLNQHIEALIFCSEQSISIDEIAGSLKLSFDWDLSDEVILQALEEIKLKYASEEFPFCLEQISEGYQFLSKREYHATISALIQHKSKKKLSVAQMETLAIIAYKQPITKSEVEHIRGVNCDYAIHKLLEKEMVSISGKSEGPGRPVLYSTSKNFMDYFGIKNPKDLPQLKDLHMEQNEIGTSSEYSDEEVSDATVSAVEETLIIDTEINSVVSANDEREILQATAEGTESETMEEFNTDSADEMPPVIGEDDGIELPDRKAIFMESQISEEPFPSEENVEDDSNDEDNTIS